MAAQAPTAVQPAANPIIDGIPLNRYAKLMSPQKRIIPKDASLTDKIKIVANRAWDQTKVFFQRLIQFCRSAKWENDRSLLTHVSNDLSKNVADWGNLEIMKVYKDLITRVVDKDPLLKMWIKQGITEVKGFDKSLLENIAKVIAPAAQLASKALNPPAST